MNIRLSKINSVRTYVCYAPDRRFILVESVYSVFSYQIYSYFFLDPILPRVNCTIKQMKARLRLQLHDFKNLIFKIFKSCKIKKLF